MSFAVPSALPGEFPRSALLHHLAAQTAPLLFVSAPLGYGKTVLGAQLARAHGAIWREGTEDQDAHDWERFLSTATARLHQAGAEKPMLVVDRADALSATVHRAIEAWLHPRSDAPQVVLLSRSNLTPLYGRHVAEQRAWCLEPNALAWTPAELERGCRAAAEDIGLQNALGWPLGSALLARLGAHAVPALASLLEQSFAGFWHVLPTLALLRDWTAPEVRRLWPEQPRAWTQDLRQHGFPMSPHAEDEQPLPIVRRALLWALAADDAQHRAAVHRVAGVISDPRDIEELVGHCVRHELLSPGRELVLRLIDAHRAAQNFARLAEAVDALPSGWMSDELSAAFGRALLETGQAVRAEVVLRSLNARGHRHPDVLHALSVLAGRQSQHERQLRLADDGLTLGGEADTNRKLRVSRAYALLNLGRHGEAQLAAQALLEESELHGDLAELAETLSLMQVVWHRCNRWREAERCIRRALQISSALELHGHAAVLLNDLAEIHRLQGETAECEALLDRALETCPDDTSLIRPLLHESQGDVLLVRARFADAAAAFSTALGLCDRHRLEALSHRLHLKLAEVACHLGQHRAADRHVRAAHACDVGHQDLQAFYEGVLAFVRREGGAASLLTRALSGGLSVDRTARAHAMLAELADTAAVRDVHLQHLRDARSHIDLSTTLANDLERLGADVRHAVVSPERRAFPAKPPTSTLECWTLGRFVVRCQERPIKFPFAKTGELLVYLLVRGGDCKERIIDALWNGSTEQRHVDYFKVTLRQLRLCLQSATGLAAPIVCDGGRYTLAPELGAWTDFSCLQAATVSSDTADLTAALELYQGDFLPNAYADWVFEERARLVEDAVTVAMSLGRRCGASDRRRASRAFERAIEIEPMQEAPYLALVELYRESGEEELARKYARALQRLA